MSKKALLRRALVMSVNAGSETEYTQRHQPIWAELEAALKAHGVHNYSIHLLPETRQLFAYMEIENEARWQAIAQTEVCQKWWKSMSHLMPCASDHRPHATPLQEVFHLE